MTTSLGRGKDVTALASCSPLRVSRELRNASAEVIALEVCGRRMCESTHRDDNPFARDAEIVRPRCFPACAITLSDRRKRCGLRRQKKIRLLLIQALRGSKQAS